MIFILQENMSKEENTHLPDFNQSIDSFGYLLKKIDTCITKLEKYCHASSSNKQDICVELQELRHNLINSNTNETKWIIR
jgi:hypothetical protein